MAHPEAIFVQLRTACNARCINCPHYFTYGKKGHHPSGVMSQQVWQKIVSDIKEMDYRGQVGLYLHHEPLLDPALFEKIRQVNEQTNAFVVISTNGALLDKNRITGLIKSSPRIVHININSADKKQYEDMTGLSYEAVIKNTRHFIAEAQGKVHVELNCPVMPGVDVVKLQELFPGTKVNSDYWANSRGGLLPQISGKDFRSRFKIEECCIQPVQNFNILHDGSVVVCCMDWMHESKKDFPNILDASIEDIYNSDIMRAVMNEFKQGVYRRYKMCEACSEEMGYDIRTERQIKSDKKMLKILLTNHHLLDLTGSEIFTFVVADFLQRNGHEVTVYSKYIDRTKGYFDLRNITAVDDLEEVRDKVFDVAHVHHNINALEVRQIFPSLPIIFLSHGVLPFLEQPPPIDIHVSRYLAVSEEVRDHLIQNGVQSDAVDIFRNVVDSEVFRPLYAINEEPRKALVLSNRIDEETERIIRDSCDRLHIDCKFVGVRFGEVEYSLIPLYINQADIVFTLGRGVIETMMCARVPIVFDYLGGDGMVTPENAAELMQSNFSGRTYKTKYSTEELIEEIAKYQSRYGKELRNIACQNFCAATNIKDLERLYVAAIKKEVPVLEPEDQTLLSNFVHSIDETRNYMENSLLRRYDGSDSRESIVAPCDHLPPENNSIMCQQAAEKSEVHNDIGALYYQLNDFENTRKHFEQALKLDPRHVIARKNLADLHVQLGNTVKAVQILQALLQEYPADIEVQDQLDRIKSHQALENIEDIDKNIQYKTFDHCCGSTAKDLAGPQERQKNQRSCSNQHPESKKKCSIIIPVFNKVEFTRQCITALRENTPEDLYELIVVDNNSTDATPEYLCSIGGNVKILSNKENLGFAKACNQGANAASGKYFVFLNNDTVPHSGWLNALVKVAEEQQDIGVVGSKLLFPDGTIQHAGVVLIETPRGKLGSHLYWGYPGNFVPANRARDFQVVTAACMLISKDLFFCVNGFDEKYINGLEDVDLCLKVRNLGKRVFYCPHSILTHFESKTVGRFDNVNHNEKLFVELWNDKIEPDKHKYLLADGFRFENHDGRISWIYHRELFGTLLSIVVCIQNSSQQFQELIKDIQTNTLVPFEIIIVDNCCAMDSQEYLEDAVDIQRIRMKNNANLAQCYNRAKEKAKGDYIVFLTPGVLLTKGWASRMILNFKDNIGAVSCLAYSRDDLMLLKNLMIHPVTKECDFNQLAWLISTWNQARQTECEYIDRGCWIIRKDIIDRIGDFDENRFAEIVELEFSLRLGKNGYKVIRANDVLIYAEKESPAHIAGKQSRNGSLQSDVLTLAEALTEKYAKKVESGLIERHLHLPDVPFRSSALPDLPLTSIIILTFNQLPYTQKCLDSIQKFTTIPYELIIVDNGSTDGTIRYLKKYSEKYTNVRLILNEVNQGFAVGNNQGIEQAQGKYILFLNNDTVVTKGWLSRMVANLERYPEAGMVGPVSNAVPVPQLIRSVPYGSDLNKMHAFAAKIARKNTGKITPFVRLVGFCLLARKEVIDLIGGFDEGYGAGNFEDDDLCLRSSIAGYTHIIARDCFVHHYGRKTFEGNKLDYNASLDTNRAYFADKWEGVIELWDNDTEKGYKLVLDPKDRIKIILKWGEDAFDQGDLKRSVQIFQRVLKLDAHNSQAINNLGVIQWQAGDAITAIETFQKVLVSFPENIDAFSNLVQAVKETGRCDLVSDAVLNQLRSHYPNSPELNMFAKEKVGS